VTDLEWTVIAVGVGLAIVIIIAADSIEKRLGRIIRLLEIGNDINNERRS
jgi:hypothetical protein